MAGSAGAAVAVAEEKGVALERSAVFCAVRHPVSKRVRAAARKRRRHGAWSGNFTGQGCAVSGKRANRALANAMLPPQSAPARTKESPLSRISFRTRRNIPLHGSNLRSTIEIEDHVGKSEIGATRGKAGLRRGVARSRSPPPCDASAAKIFDPYLRPRKHLPASGSRSVTRSFASTAALSTSKQSPAGAIFAF